MTMNEHHKALRDLKWRQAKETLYNLTAGLAVAAVVLLGASILGFILAMNRL